ncbi:bifunctional DNA primase/polymerase [Streptomyces sp. PA03-6a]|nr:bifunctional DNA primase/polymerase [Streptomyces sp. PA03-6a]
MTPVQTPLDGALWLVAHGFATFPADHPGLPQCAGVGRGHDPATCTDRGKHPAVAFSKVNTRDERQVFRWFEDSSRNVAVAVGASHGPDNARLLVVDSDRPNAIEDTAAALGYRHTPTMRVLTSKGHHDYYWAPASAGLGNGLGALRGKFDGDVRAGNAYVISAGSVHATGVLYELADPEQPPVPLPAWLLSALQRPPVAEGAATIPAPRLSGARRMLALVQVVLESKPGERNSRLYWAACRAFEHVRETGADQRAVASALSDAAQHIGLTEGEARQTITSAYRTGIAR